MSSATRSEPPADAGMDPPLMDAPLKTPVRGEDTAANAIFTDNPVMHGYGSSLFRADERLGFHFKAGDFVGRTRLLSDVEAIESARRARARGDFLLLNVGDSSTSGWNSDNVYSGVENPAAALFSYPTYSDILTAVPGYTAINGGVPGYSSHQVAALTADTLKRFAGAQVFFDYVTIYVGNNDSCYNGMEDRCRIDFALPSPRSVLTRVSEDDLFYNCQSISRTAHSYGAEPIFIVPAVNSRWEPGLRSRKHRDELAAQLARIAGLPIGAAFKESREAFATGLRDRAVELDLILPRLKRGHRRALCEAAAASEAVLIDAQELVLSGADFIDYCHPGQHLNKQLASVIAAKCTLRNDGVSEDRSRGLSYDTYTLF